MAIGLIIIFIAAQSFQNMYEEEPLYPSENVTEKKMLSEYLPELEDTPMDTEVYIFKGKEEGGTSLILGGTHPNEPAGYLTSVVFLENMQVNKGKIIIIPRANSSAFTHSSPQEAYPQKFSIEMDDGSEREFRFGSRTTNP
ncbi:MAG: succinylglutamate desuccinylase, partial [Halanaerobiales bacterium]